MDTSFYLCIAYVIFAHRKFNAGKLIYPLKLIQMKLTNNNFFFLKKKNGPKLKIKSKVPQNIMRTTGCRQWGS